VSASGMVILFTGSNLLSFAPIIFRQLIMRKYLCRYIYVLAAESRAVAGALVLLHGAMSATALCHC